VIGTIGNIRKFLIAPAQNINEVKKLLIEKTKARLPVNLKKILFQYMQEV